jgi:predicted nuclease with TOPRIM domain
MPNNHSKISFADLDTFLKVAPLLGLCVLAYLQTLFPSKIEFDRIEQQLIRMDKKITEMTVLNKAITSNTTDINQIENRLRFLEVELAKHNASDSRSPRSSKLEFNQGDGGAR